MNRTLMDKVRTKLIQTNLPKEFWGEAILCSAYELNRCPTNANKGLTPSHKWYNKNELSKQSIWMSSVVCSFTKTKQTRKKV